MVDGLNIRNEWFITARMFERAKDKNFNPDLLAQALLLTEYGYEVICEQRHSEYADELFMLSGFRREFDLGTYDSGIYSSIDVLFGCGYLYKYWFDKGFTDTKEIYRLAKPEIIQANFNTLHISGYDYWISYLKDLDGRLRFS
jgi:hypothetical protein